MDEEDNDLMIDEFLNHPQLKKDKNMNLIN